MNFELNIKNWHMVEKEGFPEDDTQCIVVWKTYDDEYEWTPGFYCKDEHYFRNAPMMILEEDSVVAWAVCQGWETEDYEGHDYTFTVSE